MTPARVLARKPEHQIPDVPRAARERAAAALDEDWPDVLKALQNGLKDKDASKAARVAIAYVQLVYGRQLQQPSDERAGADPIDVSSMTIEERNRLKQRLLAQHPHLVDSIRSDDP